MTILEAVNLHVPLVLRDLDLYKDILFDRYMHADNNEGFKNCLLKLKNDSDVYVKYQNESRLLSEFYSKEHVLNMWREFYLSAYKDKQEELLNKKNRGFYEKTEVRTKSVAYSCFNGICPVVCAKG